MIECNFCDDIYADKAALADHFEGDHNVPFYSSAAGQTYTCICDECGERFERAWSQIIDNQYCELDCHTTDKTDPVNKLRTENKKRAKERDDYTCQDCGDKQSEIDSYVHAHHVIPEDDHKDKMKAQELSNLITLCPTCHKKWEGIYLKPDNR